MSKHQPSDRPVGRPSKPETLEKLREKSERETLKLCEKLRRLTEEAAQGLLTKLQGEADLRSHAAAVESLARSAKLVAETEGAIRKGRIGEDTSGGGGESAEALLRELRELK